MRVFLPSPLRSYSGGKNEVTAKGATLAEALRDLDAQFPGIRFRVVDEQDRIREHVNFFVGGELVRTIEVPVGEGQDVHIMAALSGGAGPGLESPA